MALFPDQPAEGQEVYDPASDRWFRYNDKGYWALLDADKYLVRGQPGPRGVQGPQGITGPEGKQGATGPTGPDGLVGPTGATGALGATGLPGGPGIPGKAFCEAVVEAPTRGERGQLFITAWNEVYVTTGLY